MSADETAMLAVAIALAFIAMMCLYYKKWVWFSAVMFIAIMYYILLAVSDTQEPREPNQTILEQLREKWRDKEGEPVDGSRD